MRLSRSRRFVLCGLAAILAAGCAPLKVRSFASRDVSFERYRTYQWAEDGPRATGDPRLDSNPFFEDRLMKDAERELSSRGFEKISTGAPDLVLHYHASFSQRLDISDVDAGYRVCRDCAVGSVYDAGTIVLDFVDPRTNTLVWRSWAEGSMDGLVDNQRWMEERVDDAIRRIVATVPRRL